MLAERFIGQGALGTDVGRNRSRRRRAHGLGHVAGVERASDETGLLLQVLDTEVPETVDHDVVGRSGEESVDGRAAAETQDVTG